MTSRHLRASASAQPSAEGVADAPEASLSGKPMPPSVLWAKAHQEHPFDREACSRRYIELMTEAGHIVHRQEGDNRPMFSCGYDPRACPSCGHRRSIKRASFSGTDPSCLDHRGDEVPCLCVDPSHFGGGPS